MLGNKDTLDVIPKEIGLNVREELLKFHSKFYSANLMGLCVLGKGETILFLTNTVFFWPHNIFWSSLYNMVAENDTIFTHCLCD